MASFFLSLANSNMVPLFTMHWDVCVFVSVCVSVKISSLTLSMICLSVDLYLTYLKFIKLKA